MTKSLVALCIALISVTSTYGQDCAPVVHVDLPETIANGLSDGSMERIGGVIRYSDDRQVVAWLRHSVEMGRTTKSMAGLIEHVSRITGTTDLALDKIASGVAPLLNISITGYPLPEYIEGVSEHDDELERIYDNVSEELQRDRVVKLAAALEFAETNLLVTDDEYSQAAIVQLGSDLIEVRRQLVENLDSFYGAEMSTINIELALSTQVLAMRVCVLGTRLHLDNGHGDAANELLSNCLSEQEVLTRQFVNKWLDDRRAFYFHESVDDEYFELYLSLERWLRGKSNVLPEIVKESRKDFWVHEALNPLDSPNLFFQIDESARYKTALPSAQIAIENLQRLQGMELELGSMCLPTFAEWESYDGDGSFSISEHDGYVMLVSEAILGTESDVGP